MIFFLALYIKPACMYAHVWGSMVAGHVLHNSNSECGQLPLPYSVAEEVHIKINYRQLGQPVSEDFRYLIYSKCKYI